MAIGVSFGMILILYALIFVVAILSQLALAFCVYYDCKMNGISEAVLWAVLSGFSTIAAIVYLVIRSSNRRKPVTCPVCHIWLQADYFSCPRCGQPRIADGQPLTPALYDIWRRRRRSLFIGWIVSLVLPVVLVVVLVVLVVFVFAMNPHPSIAELGVRLML